MSGTIVPVERLKQLSLYIFFGLLAYMPLHIFLSTWLGSTFHVLEAAKILKDILLVGGFLLALSVSVRKTWFRQILKDPLLWLITAYALLTLCMAAIKPTDPDAELLGVVYNLRFLLYFCYAGLLTQLYKPEWLLRRALQVVLAVALPVLLFGMVQYLWLPNDALSHLGYSRANGVLPAFFIDDKPDLERIMSTVRDPNSYGSYLLIILSIVGTYLLRNKNKDVRKLLIGITTITLLNIYFTFSRSAWVGAVLTLLTIYLLKFKPGSRLVPNKKVLVFGCIALALLLSGLFMARETYFVKNVILHADESTVMEDPNQLRLRFWRESFESAVHNPFGYGPGTAGIVSIRNDRQGVVLNENYYLQILHETGVIGLLLFISIITTVAGRLYRIKTAGSYALLAAFVGLAFTNFLVHIWSVEAVAYTWWGLAGLATTALLSQQSRPIAGGVLQGQRKRQYKLRSSQDPPQ